MDSQTFATTLIDAISRGNLPCASAYSNSIARYTRPALLRASSSAVCRCR
jgi:hypothetical protein